MVDLGHTVLTWGPTHTIACAHTVDLKARVKGKSHYLMLSLGCELVVNYCLTFHIEVCISNNVF